MGEEVNRTGQRITKTPEETFDSDRYVSFPDYDAPFT
jgi:hypothetical protein